ncbi:MAG: ribonuclease D [Pirellulales bacterium]|nr:ribonuclease D [Pirellulales bacterium]
MEVLRESAKIPETFLLGSNRLMHQFITTEDELNELCDSLSSADTIAFDTEFISENTYRPQLCLVQISAGSIQAIIDPLKVTNIQPFWKLIAEGNQKTIVHAGREEVGFCLRATGKAPANLFDVQIASGLIGLEYPAGYRTLVKKLLQKSPAKDQTRSDWQKRPLSKKQLEYAMGDVIYLERMEQKISEKLGKLDRLSWLEEEMQSWLVQVHESHDRKKWRRVSGISGLSRRNKAIVRELFFWREQTAEKRNMPVRRVLRDDLIIEMAKHPPSSVEQIRNIRGMERGDLRKVLPEIAACVTKGLELSDNDLPKSQPRKEMPPQLNMLGQLLSSALQTICHKSQLATSIVGNPSDVRELIAYRLGLRGQEEPPKLTQTWRAELVGILLEDLLRGKVTVRIEDPHSTLPLDFEYRNAAENSD